MYKDDIVKYSQNINSIYFPEEKVMGIGFSTKVDAFPIENTFMLISLCEKEYSQNFLPKLSKKQIWNIL